MNTCPRCGAPMQSLNSWEKKCEFCGGVTVAENEIITQKTSIIKEEITQSKNKTIVQSQSGNPGCLLCFLGVIFPVLGIILLIRYAVRIKNE